MNAIVEQKQSATPAMLLQLAVEQGADLDRLERLMALQERWEANEAKKAFSAAFSAFKAESVQIIKGVTIKDGPLKGKMHADLFDVVSAATPALSRHGLSTAWKLSKDEKDWMEVTCTLSHVAGHSETVSMGGAPDAGPGRNAIQARGSVKTYLERYTLTAILGLAARESDDDGRGTKPLIEKIQGPQGVMGAVLDSMPPLDEGQKEYYDTLAHEVTQTYNNLGPMKALERIKLEKMENEEWLHLESRLDSKVRSGIKKAGEMLREAAKAKA